MLFIKYIHHSYRYFYYYFYLFLSPFIPSRNVDDVFTYNHMALMSLRSHSHIKASIVLNLMPWLTYLPQT